MHSAFSDRPRKNEPPQNPKHHIAIQVITTAFWDAYLQNNKQAKKWLKEEAAKILDPNDVWQTK